MKNGSKQQINPFVTKESVQVTHATGTNTPPYHRRCWLLNLLITVWLVLFLIGREDTTSLISKNNLTCGLVRPHHTFPLFHLCQFISDKLGPRKDGHISGCCLYRAFALHRFILQPAGAPEVL